MPTPSPTCPVKAEPLRFCMGDTEFSIDLLDAQLAYEQIMVDLSRSVIISGKDKDTLILDMKEVSLKAVGEFRKWLDQQVLLQLSSSRDVIEAGPLPTVPTSTAWQLIETLAYAFPAYKKKCGELLTSIYGTDSPSLNSTPSKPVSTPTP